MTTDTETFKGHTPGPWTFPEAHDKRHSRIVIMAEAARPAHPIIADSVFRHGHVDYETAKANARLIAAAPTLLAERDALRAMLRKALALAKGQTK